MENEVCVTDTKSTHLTSPVNTSNTPGHKNFNPSHTSNLGNLLVNETRPDIALTLTSIVPDTVVPPCNLFETTIARSLLLVFTALNSE